MNYFPRRIAFSVFTSSLGSMLFLPFVDLWIVNEPAAKEILPLSIDQQDNIEEDLRFVTPIKIKPFVIEGSVENFDPVARAAQLAKTLNKKFCGVYRSFEDDVDLEVILTFSEIKPIGQIVDLHGEMIIGGVTTSIAGQLNAKSDQLELIPLAEELPPGLEPGGLFIGLQGTNLFAWKAPRLDTSGGRLELNSQCSEKISKAPTSSIWRLL